MHGVPLRLERIVDLIDAGDALVDVGKSVTEPKLEAGSDAAVVVDLETLGPGRLGIYDDAILRRFGKYVESGFPVAKDRPQPRARLVVGFRAKRPTVRVDVLESKGPLRGELRREVSIQAIEGVLVVDWLPLPVVAPARAQRVVIRKSKERVDARTPVAVVGVGSTVIPEPDLQNERIQELKAIADICANGSAFRLLGAAGYPRIEASGVRHRKIRVLRDAILPIEVRVHRPQIVTPIEEISVGALKAEILLEARDREGALSFHAVILEWNEGMMLIA